MPELKIKLSQNAKGVSIDDFKKELERRVCRLKGWYSEHVYKAMVPKVNDSKEHAHRWSGYFRANWNVSIGGADFSTVDERGWEGDQEDTLGTKLNLIDKDKCKKLIDANASSLLDAPVYICNGVWYGKWLRDGVPSSYLSSLSQYMSGGQDQEDQMSSLAPRGNEFENFQQAIEDESTMIDWENVMYSIRREKAGSKLTDNVRVKTFLY